MYEQRTNLDGAQIFVFCYSSVVYSLLQLHGEAGVDLNQLLHIEEDAGELVRGEQPGNKRCSDQSLDIPMEIVTFFEDLLPQTLYMLNPVVVFFR